LASSAESKTGVGGGSKVSKAARPRQWRNRVPDRIGLEEVGAREPREYAPVINERLSRRPHLAVIPLEPFATFLREIC